MDKKAALIFLATRKKAPAVEWNVFREDDYWLTSTTNLSARVTKLPATGTKVYIKTVADWSSSNLQPTLVNEIVECVVGGDFVLYALNADCTIRIQAISSYSGIQYELSSTGKLQPKLKIYWAYA